VRLKGKTAIITGGGSGIGKAISILFAEKGAKVVIASRTLSHLELTVEEIRSKGGEAIAVQMDISDETEVRNMVAQAIDAFGTVDILVNNSAAMIPDEIEVANMSLSHWNKVMSVNLTGAMLCAREALKSMISQKSGNIINVSSIAGVIGNPKRSPYSASKWGMNGLTETLAIEVGKHNIRVNSLSPAATNSERFKDSIKKRADRLGIPFKVQMEKLLSHYSLKRLVDSSEIASAALFLASNDASAITGQNLIVSCGFHMLNPTEIE
jgi:NAD(P)-dependent dehydrogenase (short-subunit alcohol dehydrogenase family)